MQLAGHAAGRPQATTIAAALADAARTAGHRPAITVLGAGPAADRRDEQSFASLQQWVAKGAHLLEVDLGLVPGDRVHLDAPAGWLSAAVCLAVWWVGAVVTDDPTEAVASVVHESRVDGPVEGWVLGDAVDGSPAGEVEAEPWSLAVQTFPDHPPPSRASATSVALEVQGAQRDQSSLLAVARSLPAGRLGVRGPLGLAEWPIAVAVRPATSANAVVWCPEGFAATAAIESERIHAWR